jgi:pimeloyl-ACP methyl ester carboxylesterase
MNTGVLSTGAAHQASKPVRRTRVWFKRIMVGTALTILTLGGVGAIYQTIGTARDLRAYPPPGQMINIGGRRIHLQVSGQDQGQPTVILEAGIAGFSSNYYWVQTELSKTNRVVAYDRAGLGWSDPAPEPQDAQQSAKDLYAALQKAGITGPYVIAGHSYGGLVVRAFRDLYPDQTVGMVLIDASNPDQWVRMPVSFDSSKMAGVGNLVFGFLSRFGIVRFFHMESALYSGLPEQQAAEMEANLARPLAWKTSGDTILIWNERIRPQINQASSLGDMPLGVISVTDQPFNGETLTQLQDELVTLSSNSLHYTEQGATHESLVAEQGHALTVARIIRQVLESARTGQALSNLSPDGG